MLIILLVNYQVIGHGIAILSVFLKVNCSFYVRGEVRSSFHVRGASEKTGVITTFSAGAASLWFHEPAKYGYGDEKLDIETENMSEQ